MHSSLVARRLISLALFPIAALGFAVPARGQSDSLDQRIEKIISRPVFAHARFGIRFIDASTGTPIYELNSQELFVPASTTKLLTMGTALETLGADYRFHTRIYRSGPIAQDGTLKGDLILVAAGDPNLSNRIQPDGSLAFENEDHSYGGPDSNGLPGDPLLVIRELAKQVAAKGIKRVKGHVLVDATLFPEGDRELGTDVVLSPIVVNDNVVDVTISPGPAEGSPAQIKISPQTSYIKIVNQVLTGKSGSPSSLKYENERQNPDGTRAISLTGSIALGARPTMNAYPVPEPSRFAAALLLQALKEQGIAASLAPPDRSVDFKALAKSYTPETIVARHVSPPLKEEVKVTLKVSQNLHASSWPFILGAVVARRDKEIDQAGFELENKFLTGAGLDLSGAAQGDGAGGNAFFTPDFMTHYLLFMSNQKDYADFYNALPILGRDGTLFKIQVNSPAAGHVHAKTGTFTTYDALNKRILVTGKGLAGYMDTRSGGHLIFALYVNNVSVALDDPEATQKICGEALGEIAAAAYDVNLPATK